jgi:hypothetical protein
MWARYRAGAADSPSSGDIEITFHGGRPTDVQLAAVDATRARAAPMQEILLGAIVAAYPTLRAWQDRSKSLTKGELKDRIQLYEVIIAKEAHANVAYVAYVFACEWDPSGFVVLTHGDRVVSVGGLEVLEYPLKDASRSISEPATSTPAARRTVSASAERQAESNPPSLRKVLDGDARIHLAVWARFSAGPGSTGSNGEIGVSVGGDVVARRAVGPAQEAAYRHVVDGSAAMQLLLLDAIVANAISSATVNAQTSLPKNMGRDTLESLIELTTIHIHWAERDGLAYVGYEFACTWDIEHGLGVLTHADRIVAVGRADTSFLSSIAERDVQPPSPPPKWIFSRFRVAADLRRSKWLRRTPMWRAASFAVQARRRMT